MLHHPHYLHRRQQVRELSPDTSQVCDMMCSSTSHTFVSSKRLAAATNIAGHVPQIVVEYVEVVCKCGFLSSAIIVYRIVFSPQRLLQPSSNNLLKHLHFGLHCRSLRNPNMFHQIKINFVIFFPSSYPLICLLRVFDWFLSRCCICGF